MKRTVYGVLCLYPQLPIIQQNKKLLLIAPCSPNVVNTLAANVVRNGLKLCNIVPPSFGYKTHELMSDIAVAIGAKFYSEKTGDDLSLLNPPEFTSIEVKASVFSIIICPPLFNLMLGFNNAFQVCNFFNWYFGGFQAHSILKL